MCVVIGKAEAQRNGTRRKFSFAYKMEVLSQARVIKGKGHGQLKAYLQEKGLRTSHLAAWSKQIASGMPRESAKGRPPDSQGTLLREVIELKQKLFAMEKRAIQAEQLVALQLKYVKGAALKMARKDRGLLAELISQIESEISVASICAALTLSRRDFYRTIKPHPFYSPKSASHVE